MRTLQVERRGEDDIALERRPRLLEFLLQRRVADRLRGVDHLAEELLQPAEATNDAA